MTRVFISYRRHDTGYITANLSEKLQLKFGAESVFYDVDTIPLGVDFREHIGNAVGNCDVLLVIIGDQWLRSTDKKGNRRIDDPADYLRIEIESALKRAIPIIPVLVDDAVMPTPADLPDSIQAIVFRNAAEIRAGRDLRQHIERLIEGLEKLPSSSQSKSKVTYKTEAGARGRKTSPKKKDSRRTKNPLVQKMNRRLTSERASQNVASEKRRRIALLKEIQKILPRSIPSEGLFIGKEIPSYKLSNAIAAYAPGVLAENVILLYDSTLFGGAKDGLLLTTDSVHWRNASGDCGRILYVEIKTVKCDIYLQLNKKQFRYFILNRRNRSRC
jgi:hypothetical protein